MRNKQTVPRKGMLLILECMPFAKEPKHCHPKQAATERSLTAGVAGYHLWEKTARERDMGMGQDQSINGPLVLAFVSIQGKPFWAPICDPHLKL